MGCPGDWRQRKCLERMGPTAQSRGHCENDVSESSSRYLESRSSELPGRERICHPKNNRAADFLWQVSGESISNEGSERCPLERPKRIQGHWKTEKTP